MRVRGGVVLRILAPLLGAGVVRIQAHGFRTDPVAFRIQQRDARDAHEPVRCRAEHGQEGETGVFLAPETDFAAPPRITASRHTEHIGSSQVFPCPCGNDFIPENKSGAVFRDYLHAPARHAARLPVGDPAVVGDPHDRREVRVGGNPVGRAPQVPVALEGEGVDGAILRRRRLRHHAREGGDKEKYRYRDAKGTARSASDTRAALAERIRH